MNGIESLQPIGPGRFLVTLRTPWGQEVPAEMLLTTARGWPERDEAQDPRWSALAVGPAVVALRLLGTPAPRPPARLRRPAAAAAEWN
jgi:hypothetical protein